MYKYRAKKKNYTKNIFKYMYNGMKYKRNPVYSPFERRDDEIHAY